MPFRSNVYTIGTSSVQVLDAQPGDVEVTLRLRNGTDIAIGGTSSVTTSTGYHLTTGTTFVVEFKSRIRAGDELWAIGYSAAAGDIEVLIRSI